MKQILTSGITLLLGVSSIAMAGNEPAQVGPRPLYLVSDMEESPLKTKLESCSDGPFYRSDFSIGHRGAAMQFPEHTKESYLAAIAMGAGVLARTGDKSRLEAALASGAQYISTDYMNASETFGTDYQAALPGGAVARCNPVNVVDGCADPLE